MIWIVPISVVIALLFAGFLTWDVLRRDKGTKEAQEIGGFIYDGAIAFIKRQYRTIAMLSIVVAVILAAVVGVFGTEEPPKGSNIEPIEGFGLAWRTGVAFFIGALSSAIAGIIGLIAAVKTNVRTAAAASRSLGEAVMVSLRGGAISGILVVALSLLGVYSLFMLFGGGDNPEAAPFLIVGYGFGASFVALFAQLGGGIYTKAADVGADLVGKVEAGIPEDDPRNAAVVADLVGDNVGDCAGRGADLFESTAAESIGAMILGVALWAASDFNVAWIFFPLVVRGLGLLASIVGLFAIRPGSVKDPQRALDVGFWVTAILSVAGMTFAALVMLESWWFVLAGHVGILTSVAFVYITQYYTSGTWRPVQEIAEASKTGPATNIIAGLAIGFENTAIPIITISLALGSSYWLGLQGVEDLGLAVPHLTAGVFGTAVATMGMLMSAAYILAMDTFGPIADNAGGIAEFSEAGEETRKITDGLDAVGNTTKALTKGYAVASAALAAFLLFSAYLEKAHIEQVDLAKVEVFIGAMLGAMLVFLFSALAIRAVGRASSAIIEEVRRQFREHPGIMDRTEKPDYQQAVDIAAASALRNMIAPGVLAVAMPIAVGLILRAEAMAGFLMVGTITGVIMGLVMNNSGGAWDNAKKLVELGLVRDDEGNVIPKGSPVHDATVVGDTVGDPFKDTAGPSLHVLVKLLSTITLVLAPVFI
jgi:K(+)-stimulated pyrophosphate-energized sodium pump